MCKAILEKCMVLEKTIWKSTGIMGFGKDPFAKQFCKRGLGKDPERMQGFWKRPMHSCIYTGAKAPAITKKRKVKNGFGVGGSWVGIFFLVGSCVSLFVLFSVCFPFLMLTSLFFFVCMFGVCFFCLFLCIHVWMFFFLFLFVMFVNVFRLFLWWGRSLFPLQLSGSQLGSLELATCHA